MTTLAGLDHEGHMQNLELPAADFSLCAWPPLTSCTMPQLIKYQKIHWKCKCIVKGITFPSSCSIFPLNTFLKNDYLYLLCSHQQCKVKQTFFTADILTYYTWGEKKAQVNQIVFRMVQSYYSGRPSKAWQWACSQCEQFLLELRFHGIIQDV